MVRRIPRSHLIIEFPELKLDNLFSVLNDIKERDRRIYRTVILTHTDGTAKFLTHELSKRGISSSPVYGTRKRNKVRRAADGFNDGRYEVMIVSKSGLDVETGDIKHFINYDLVMPNSLNLFKQTLRRRNPG